MNRLRWWLVLALPGALIGAVPADVGVVVLHGKFGTPHRDVVRLADGLRARHYLVEAPVLPWAEDRIYAASYGDALRQVGSVIAGLRARGARLIFIAGHSLGANAALGYAAGPGGLAGLVLLAPGQFPENPDYERRVAPSRDKARRWIAQGRGGELTTFQDPIQAFAVTVRATPVVFLSYADPEGPAVMWRNAAAIPRPIPILLIQENNPAVSAEDERIFRSAPPDPLSRYVRSPASHAAVPDASVDEVLAWIAKVIR